MHTIVDEDVNLSKLRQQSRKTPPTRPLDIRPAVPQIVSNRRPDLVMQFGPQWRRKVDATKMPGSVPFECFEDHPRREAARDTRFNDMGRF
jgi:hypothetical protein